MAEIVALPCIVALPQLENKATMFRRGVPPRALACVALLFLAGWAAAIAQSRTAARSTGPSATAMARRRSSRAAYTPTIAYAVMVPEADGAATVTAEDVAEGGPVIFDNRGGPVSAVLPDAAALAEGAWIWAYNWDGSDDGAATTFFSPDADTATSAQLVGASALCVVESAAWTCLPIMPI
jgi:hypothetical protein